MSSPPAQCALAFETHGGEQKGISTRRKRGQRNTSKSTLSLRRVCLCSVLVGPGCNAQIRPTCETRTKLKHHSQQAHQTIATTQTNKKNVSHAIVEQIRKQSRRLESRQPTKQTNKTRSSLGAPREHAEHPPSQHKRKQKLQRQKQPRQPAAGRRETDGQPDKRTDRQTDRQNETNRDTNERTSKRASQQACQKNVKKNRSTSKHVCCLCAFATPSSIVAYALLCAFP